MFCRFIFYIRVGNKSLVLERLCEIVGVFSVGFIVYGVV